MNGEVLTFELDQPRSWDEYKEIPDHLKAEYLQYLWAKYETSPTMLAEMFGVSTTLVYNERHRLGLELPTKKGIPLKSVKDKWTAFLAEKEKNNVEEKPEKPDADALKKDEVTKTVNNLRSVLEKFIGTGAKITIELTL